MKKILIAFLTILSILSSCKKDDSPTYSQDMLNGTWENVQKDENNCTNQLVITPQSISENTICEGFSSGIIYENYKFDGKKITASFIGINVEFIIESLTATKLVLTIKASGYSKKAEYKKV